MNRKLSSFKKDINIIKKHGFNPIAVTQMMFEETFVFETEDEATKAHSMLENCKGKSKVVGWWYGKEYYLKTVKDYEEKMGCKVLTYWLNDKK